MKVCHCGATTMRATFQEDVDACAAAGLRGLEVWATKLEVHLRDNDALSILDDLAKKSVSLVAASYQGGLLLSQGEQRREHFDHFRKRLELCERLAIPTLNVAADFTMQVEGRDIERAIVSLRQAAQWASGFGVTLALEFRGGDSFCTNLATASAFVESAAEDNVGICLDVFHYHKGPSKFHDLQQLPKSRIKFVQLSDVAGVSREWMRDSDRILPGDGEFQLLPILQQLHDADYDGWISAELLNSTIWQAPSVHVTELAAASIKRLLDQLQ
jgi:4-hydroxyphenylpyruvate dioxygenase